MSQKKYPHQSEHICHILQGHIWGIYVHIYATYEVTSINHVTRSSLHILENLHFILLPYITEQIWLPRRKCSSHYSHSVWTQKLDINKYMYQNRIHSNIYWTCHLHIYIPETNMPANLHVIYLMGIYGNVIPYICHILSQWHQPRDQECCTHWTPMWTMMPVLDCIRCVGL